MFKNKPIEIPIFETVLLFVILVIIAGVKLLTFDSYSPLTSILYGSIAFIAIFFLCKFKVVLKDARWDWTIFFIIIISLLIRLNPWLYLEGGQDQGVYVAMSKQYELSGGLHYKDNVVDDLSTELKQKYTETLGWRALGFNRNDTNGEITTNFYPAHPISMSIFGYMFGDENRVLSLTFFSIVSIIVAYFLTVEISGNKVAGYVAAALIGLSPIHLYFSKFPVTEIMTLALNLSAIYFFFKAKTAGWHYLLLSLLVTVVLLFTRLTWVIALPFFGISLIFFLAFEKDKKKYLQFGLYGIGLLAAVLTAIAFYYYKIPFLYKHFFADIFHFVPRMVFYVGLITSPLTVWLLTTVFKKFTQNVLITLFKYRVWLFSAVLLFLVYVTVKNFYFMAFTDKYIGGQYDRIWGMAHGGWIVLKDMAFSSLVIYLTPFGILGLILSLKSTNTPERTLLMIFLLSYLFFHFYIVKFTPYHFYFARYQLSEIIPVILIFISIFVVETFRDIKWLALLIAIPMILYSAIYVPFLFQGPVGTSSKLFKDLRTVVQQEDVIIYYNTLDWADNFVFSPLKYYFNFNAINSDQFSDVIAYSKGIPNKEKFVLSTTQVNDPQFKYVKTLTFTKGFYANAKEDHPPLTYVISNWQIPFCNRFIPEKFCSGVIPIQYHKASLDLYLYNYIGN